MEEGCHTKSPKQGVSRLKNRRRLEAERDRDLRANIKEASSKEEAKRWCNLLWTERRQKTRKKKAMKMIRWSEGAPGWKKEFMKCSKECTASLSLMKNGDLVDDADGMASLRLRIAHTEAVDLDCIERRFLPTAQRHAKQ